MKILVAYYTRTGNTKKAAEAIARALRAVPHEVELEEIVDTKPRGGILGWIGAGIDSVLGRKITIEPAKADVASFDLVIAGGPIWSWRPTTPVTTFLTDHAAEIRRAAFFCTMTLTGWGSAFPGMEEAAGSTPVATMALVDRHVKSGDENEFLAKVEEFAGEVARAMGGDSADTTP